MWSSVVLFVLTFVVLGLLLGLAADLETNQENQDDVLIRENVSHNVTENNSLSGNPEPEEVEG